MPIYSPVRNDLTSRGAEEGQSVSGRRVRAERRRAVHDTFAGRRSAGGSRGRLRRFRSVSRRVSDVSRCPRSGKNRVHNRGEGTGGEGGPIRQRVGLPDTLGERERVSAIDGRHECTRENDVAPNWRNWPSPITPGRSLVHVNGGSAIVREIVRLARIAPSRRIGEAAENWRSR